MNHNMLESERNLLSAERTFSSWVRTALTAMAGGLAILRLITFKTELHRVMVHGVLHYCGHNDKTPNETQLIRLKENHYMEKLQNIH